MHGLDELVIVAVNALSIGFTLGYLIGRCEK